MKKSFILGLLPISLLFVIGTAHAQMGMMSGYYQNENQIQFSQNEEITSILQGIYADQNISSQAEVDCSKVTDNQFEELGDAYMGIMVPSIQQHEAMDAMMGGEGSASLEQAHINMGRSYLGCWSDYDAGPVYMPMMGGFGMMGGNGLYTPTRTGLMSWPGMMGGYHASYAWLCGITLLLVWTFLITGSAAFMKWLRKK